MWPEEAASVEGDRKPATTPLLPRGSRHQRSAGRRSMPLSLRSRG